jgi:hypothetical protein
VRGCLELLEGLLIGMRNRIIIPIGTKEVEDEAGVVLFVDGDKEDEEDEAGVELPLEELESRSRSRLRGTESFDDGFPDSLSEGGDESADSSC